MVVGNTIQLQTGIEQALWGFDGEVGWRLPLGDEDEDEDLEVRVFGGGFYFSGSQAPDVAGPQARVEMRLYDLDFLEFLGANSPSLKSSASAERYLTCCDKAKDPDSLSCRFRRRRALEYHRPS